MASLPRYDFHIHTKYLKCANEAMEVPAIVDECRRLGVTKVGIADHLNSLDKLDFHIPIRRDIESLDNNISVYFGVELNFQGCDGNFAFSEEIKEQYGFQFAIAGIHGAYLEEYDLKQMIDIQHRHHLKTCADPLVNVLVHPYWFNRKELEKKGFPMFDSMAAVPESYTRELGRAAKESDTAIEINASLVGNKSLGESFFQEYVDYLAIIADEGARFSMASDAHNIDSLGKIDVAWEAAEKLKLTPEQIWTPPCPPMKGD